jgi:hypothetical protein
MAINDELWRVVASGGLTLLLNKMQAFADIDTRARLLDKRDFLRWLRVELAAPGSLAFAISESVLGLLWDEVQGSAYYAPELRPQAVPMVTGAAVDGVTLVADDPGEGLTTYVCHFNWLTFSEVGPLATDNQPGVGVYVLANQDEDGRVSLPSGFLTIS